ncbi:MAG: hypothetical protein HZB50_08510 [Chloroflexi bacterium]|nr:hypothetical protein [Chloroflexota bacterium]
MRFCHEVSQWITDNIETPIENWVTQTETQCVAQPCNWWCLCCNKWFCFLVTLLVRVVTFIIVTVTRLVTVIVCEIVGFILDLGAFFINLLLSIPIIGGIIRTVLNWLTEIFWRLVGLPDFLLSLIGVQLPKKMYVKLIILNNNGVPLTNEAAVMPFINQAHTIFQTECNVNMIYTGVCVPRSVTPQEALTISCDVGGFFADWWIAGSYFERVTADCAFKDGWRRILGNGAEIIVFVIGNVTPDSSSSSTIGCSMGPTYNYVVVEVNSMGAIAHEIAHSCGLWHITDTTNLMNPNLLASTIRLSTTQRSIFRNSRHVTFI